MSNYSHAPLIVLVLVCIRDEIHLLELRQRRRASAHWANWATGCWWKAMRLALLCWESFIRNCLLPLVHFLPPATKDGGVCRVGGRQERLGNALEHLYRGASFRNMPQGHTARQPCALHCDGDGPAHTSYFPLESLAISFSRRSLCPATKMTHTMRGSLGAIVQAWVARSLGAYSTFLQPSVYSLSVGRSKP